MIAVMIRQSCLIALLLSTASAMHYKGGTITWRPVDETSTSDPVQILIQEKHTWTYPRFDCSQTLIATQGSYFDANSPLTYPNIACIGACTTTGGYTPINAQLFCTDYNVNTMISTGAYYTKRYLYRTANLDIAYTGSAWANTIPIVGGASTSGGTASWSVMTHIDLTGTGSVINSSPVTGSLGLIKVIQNQIATIQIPIADWNTGQTLRCRWGNTYNECGNICGDLLQYGATLGASDCTMSWLAQLRPYDASNGLVTSTYVAAIMVEDFENSTSTTALSSVPLQMIVYVYTPATGACSIVPNITGDRPNRACIGVPINVTFTERVVAQVYCTDASSGVVEFVTTSPLWMTKTLVAPVSGTTNQYYINLTWTPVDDQYGPQVFCAAPIDGRGLTGPQYCVNYVVGLGAPDLIQTTLVQGNRQSTLTFAFNTYSYLFIDIKTGTASPVGTVFANQSQFSILATQGVHRPNRNGTYISIYLASTNTLVWQADAGYSSDILYTAKTVLFIVRNASWTFGATYYILFASGTASGVTFCGPESAPITDPTFWRFNIWDPGLSSTTTTTTTAPTTHSITTRPLLTTTVNTALTTTGVATTSSSSPTTVTTVTTTTTSTTSFTTLTTESTTTTVTELSIFTPKDMENACKQPVVIMTIVTVVAMLPINIIGMFALFIHLNKLFNPNQIQARVRQNRRLLKLFQ